MAVLNNNMKQFTTPSELYQIAGELERYVEPPNPTEYYENCYIETRYSEDRGIVQQAYSSATEEICAIFKTHQATAVKVVSWVLERNNQKPALPMPEETRENEVLSNIEFLLPAPQTTAGGFGINYMVAGVYTYLLYRPRRAGETLNLDHLPHMRASVSDLQLEGFRFVAGMLRELLQGGGVQGGKILNP